MSVLTCAVILSLRAVASGPGEDLEPRSIPAVFDLSLKVDAGILGTSAAMFAGALLIERGRTGPDVTGDPGHIWSFDRIAIGRSSPGQSAASTVLQDALVIAAPLALAISEWDARPKGFIPALIVVESIVASSALNQLTKSLVHRPRPYAYARGSASGEADRSFYSGHTTASFAAVTSAALVLRDLHPGSAAPLWLGTVGFIGATAVGVLRVTSGQHFPSDVVVAALAGIAVGWAVPTLHKKPSRLTLGAGPNGFVLVGVF
jgi:membrane-associated phospholipid phosphatase